MCKNPQKNQKILRYIFRLNFNNANILMDNFYPLS